ncbi:MAG: diguanylate cyclase [Oscillospiraceae bacterium]|nr:diguanylate cyclase [Oscillospiraceae bacterium]
MPDTDTRNWIAVVDDEALSLSSARTLLAAEDMKISCLPSGRSLLKFMEKNSPDLILLDVMMPDMDGFETFAALREQERKQNRPETPIIFLTGDSAHETERQGLKIGAADYIHKPFNKDVLISRIRNTIAKSRIIESLTEDATTDSLTGLLNKAEGVSRIREALSAGPGTLLTVDIDSFKLVNDLFGHEKGDQILRAFADLTKASTRDGDILSRIGGDEFILYCAGLHSEAAVSGLTARLNTHLDERAKEVLGADHGIPLGISAGAVMVPDYGTDYEALFRMADEAMYRTKRNGKRGCTIYTGAVFSPTPSHSPGEELTRITRILEERNPGRDALILGPDAFTTIYQYVGRHNSRHGLNSLVLLFILTGYTEDDGVLTAASSAFVQVLKNVLGRSDLIMRTKDNQFVVLLPGPGTPEAEAVAARVLSSWAERPESAGIEILSASQLR